MHKLHLRELFGHPAHLPALGFGAGLSPWAPGTVGTLVALPLYWLAQRYAADYFFWIVLLAALAGVYLCAVTAKNLHLHDHPAIVWDEIVGYGCTMLWLPCSWQWAIGGVLLFRLFDIVKPWPIGWVDRRVSGGIGIVLDDVIAGLLACALLHGVRILLA